MALPRAKSTESESKLAEVRFINGYALFMGFLSMAVRGLGFLVITWTTVVLLGGFVSMLGEKDFWCLTLITLIQITVIQTAGVFDVHTKEKMTYIRKSCQGFYDTMRMMDKRKGVHARPNGESSIACRQFYGIARHVITFVVACLQALVFAIILCPLGALYACGLHISGGISLWRLIQHDFGNADADPIKANMNPALQVLYALALVQCVLFSYSVILLLARGKVVNTVAVSYGFQGDAVTSVDDYLETTCTRLAKNPSLSTGRNLVTYAVKLMESESPDEYRSGTRILDTIITDAMKDTEKDALPAEAEEHKGKDLLMLIERLVGSPSSSIIFHKLLKTLGSRSPWPDDIKIRESSARIVAHLAGNIGLNQYPRGIECISSLFDSSGQHEVDVYKELVLQGLRIFGKLAADQENCRVMGCKNGLLSMIMMPVSSDLLHRVDHATWSDIVDASLQVMCCLLTTAPKDTATNLGHEVSNNSAAMESMRDIILDCKLCGEERHMLALQILTQLPTESNGDVQREKITRRLVSIFGDEGKDIRIRELAGEKLVTLSFQSQNIALLQEDSIFVDTLVKLLLEDTVNKCRISAAGILEALSSSKYSDEKRFQHLKKVITDVMPKVQVLRQIFCRESTQAQAVSHFGQVSSDIEGQNSAASGGIGQKDGRQHDEDKELQVALLSLYVTVYEKLISTDTDLALRFLNDPRELKKMAQRNSDPKVAGCLRTLKLITKMAILTMSQKKGIHPEHVQYMEPLIGALESASYSMLGLDGFVLITGREDGETLASLVNKARRLSLGETQE